ncbi:putative peptide modification system cyclase [Lysobacter sp. A286]
MISDPASSAPAASSGVPRLCTILLTDLVDSTAWVERLGDGAAADLFRAHDRLTLELLQQWSGRLIDRSDGLLLLFERPIDGLAFALDYNRGLARLGTSHAVVLEARTGLHVGEVLSWRNSDEAVSMGAKPVEVEGLAKPMAARLMTMARPGQILLSATAESLTHRAARELGERGKRLSWQSHGRWRFKGVSKSQEVFEVGEAGLAPLRSPCSSAKAWRDVALWRRPAALVAEAAMVLTLGVGLWVMAKPQPAIAFNERDWVVLADLRNLTDQPLLSASLEQAFRISLEQSRHVNVLSDLKTQATLVRMQRKAGTGLDRALASEIAIRDGARAVILPTVAEVGGRVRVSAEVIDPHSQTTVYAEYADGKGALSALASIDQVTATLRERLGEALEGVQRDSVPLPEVTTGNLDALRTYALARKATAEQRWEDAKHLYQHAIKLDDGFALAYMGLVQLHWSSIDYKAALPYLDKALSLRAALPPRDRLYLEAWKAETASTGTPLEEWRMLASLYPDYFAGASNASWYLLEANRFKEALPYAEAAAVPQDPLRAFPIRHIGHIRFALGDPAAALEQYRLADRLGNGQPTRHSAAALAALGRYDEAWQILDVLKPREGDPSSFYMNLDRVSVALDQQRFEVARKKAAEAMAATAPLDEFHRHNFELIAQSAALADKPGDVSVPSLRRVARAAEARLQDVNSPARQGDAFRLLMAAYLAQRSGDSALSGDVLQHSAAAINALDDINTGKLLVIVQATQLRLKGDHDAAIALLEPQIDGFELLQAHSALLAAYEAVGKDEQAGQQTRWLAAHLGRAYAEIGHSQLLQPINVADVRQALSDGN